MTRLSIIVPVYNEQATIIPILEAVSAQQVPGVELETIVINDGSTDDTAARIEERPELYVKFVNLTQNGGKGAAVKAGLAAASGEFILFQDADLEYSPSEYAKLLAPVLEYDADLVIGSRFIAPQCTRVFYFWNKVGNRLITLVFNLLNNTTFTDIYSCYLLYRRELVPVDQLRTEGWEQHAEILCKLVKKSDKFYEVPINYNGRKNSSSK